MNYKNYLKHVIFVFLCMAINSSKTSIAQLGMNYYQLTGRNIAVDFLATSLANAVFPGGLKFRLRDI